MSSKGLVKGASFAMLMGFVVSVFGVAHADYYGGDAYYGGGGGGGYGGGYGNYAGSYGGYGGGGGSRPIISLELNEKESLNSSLRIAARENRLEDLKRFVAQGGDINSQSSHGDTALMYAARNCSNRIVRYILSAKPNVNLKNHLGRTALMFAAYGSCAPVVKLLLDNPETDMNLKDREGRAIRDYALYAAELEVGGPASETYAIIRAAERARHAHGKRIVHRGRRQ